MSAEPLATSLHNASPLSFGTTQDGSGRFRTTQHNKVSADSFEGDDPLIFTVVYLWMMMFRSKVFDGRCENMFDGGGALADSARAVAGAVKELTSRWD